MKKVEEKKTKNIILIIACLLLAVFIAMVIMSSSHRYKPSKKIVCFSNLRSLSIACLVFHREKECWPGKDNWCESLQLPVNRYNQLRNYMQCPADKIGPCSYAMNENIPANANELPDDLVLLFESAPGWNQTGGADDVVTERHSNPGANIAFPDGRVEFVKPEDVPNLRWTIEE